MSQLKSSILAGSIISLSGLLLSLLPFGLNLEESVGLRLLFKLRGTREVPSEVIVVTVGENEWGYPDQKTMVRLSQHCPIVLRTDEVGTIVLESDGNRMKVIQPEGIKP